MIRSILKFVTLSSVVFSLNAYPYRAIDFDEFDSSNFGVLAAAPSHGLSPHVKVNVLKMGSTCESAATAFNCKNKLKTGEELGSFMAYDVSMNAGVKLALGRLIDSKLNVATAPCKGVSPHVKVFNTDGVLRAQFMAYDLAISGGVSLAVWNSGVEDGKNYLVTVPALEATTHVKVWDVSNEIQGPTIVDQFFAYDPSYTGGATLSTGDLDNDGVQELVIGTAQMHTRHIKIYKMVNGHFTLWDQYILPDPAAGFIGTGTSVLAYEDPYSTNLYSGNGDLRSNVLTQKAYLGGAGTNYWAGVHTPYYYVTQFYGNASFTGMMTPPNGYTYMVGNFVNILNGNYIGYQRDGFNMPWTSVYSTYSNPSKESYGKSYILYGKENGNITGSYPFTSNVDQDVASEIHPFSSDFLLNIAAYPPKNLFLAPKVSSVVAGQGTQRSMVTSIAVVFDRKIRLATTNPAANFQLKNTMSNTLVSVNAALDSSSKKITLTFVGGAVNGPSLSDGIYELKIIACAGYSADSCILSSNEKVQVNDYTLVGTKANGLFRLFGDADGDGKVGSSDFIEFRAAFNNPNVYNAAFDFDGNGKVDGADFIQIRSRFNTEL